MSRSAHTFMATAAIKAVTAIVTAPPIKSALAVPIVVTAPPFKIVRSMRATPSLMPVTAIVAMLAMSSIRPMPTFKAMRAVAAIGAMTSVKMARAMRTTRAVHVRRMPRTVRSGKGKPAKPIAAQGSSNQKSKKFFLHGSPRCFLKERAEPCQFCAKNWGRYFSFCKAYASVQHNFALHKAKHRRLPT